MIRVNRFAFSAWISGLHVPAGYKGCDTRFYEAYLEGIAIVPPYVHMPQYIAEKTLLRQLLERQEGETGPDVMSWELVKNAKRTKYDVDTRRLTFIMPDQAGAASWHAKSILFGRKRLQMFCPATMERDDFTNPLLPATSKRSTPLALSSPDFGQWSGGKLGSSYFGALYFLCGDIRDSWMLTRLGGV